MIEFYFKSDSIQFIELEYDYGTELISQFDFNGSTYILHYRPAYKNLTHKNCSLWVDDKLVDSNILMDTDAHLSIPDLIRASVDSYLDF